MLSKIDPFHSTFDNVVTGSFSLYQVVEKREAGQFETCEVFLNAMR